MLVVAVPWLVEVVGCSLRLLKTASSLSFTRSRGVDRMLTLVFCCRSRIRRGMLVTSPLVMPTNSPAMSAGTVFLEGKPPFGEVAFLPMPKLVNPWPWVVVTPSVRMASISVPISRMSSEVMSRMATSKSTWGRRTSRVSRIALTSVWM